MSEVKPEDVISLTFHIMQNGKPVAKAMKLTRANMIKYNLKPNEKWADMYKRIVDAKAYISIKDLANVN